MDEETRRAIEQLEAWGVLHPDGLSPIRQDSWHPRAQRNTESLRQLIESLREIRRTLAPRVRELRRLLDELESSTSPVDVLSRSAVADSSFSTAIQRYQQVGRQLREARWAGGDRLRRRLDHYIDADSLPIHTKESITSPNRQNSWDRVWNRRLRQTERYLNDTNNMIDGVIERAIQFSDPDPPDDFDNPYAVMINFGHRSLIPVSYAGRRPPGSDVRHPIDPVFALRVVRFLKALRRNAYTRVYSNGFQRHVNRNGEFQSPRHPMDFNHARGEAWDISGFEYIGLRYLLRSGRSPIEYTGPSDPSYNHITRGYSQFYVESDNQLISGSGIDPVFDEFLSIMMSVFGSISIIGPGYNSKHDTHFHVQLSPMRTRIHMDVQPGGARLPVSPGVTATRSDPHPWMPLRRRIRITHQDWGTTFRVESSARSRTRR